MLVKALTALLTTPNLLDKEGLNHEYSCWSLGNLTRIHVRFILIEPSRFWSIFSHNYFCFLYMQFYGEWRGVIFLSFTPVSGLVPSSQVTVDAQRESISLTTSLKNGGSHFCLLCGSRERKMVRCMCVCEVV